MTDNEELEAFLAHYGVKGMKWGVRKDRPAGVSAKTNRAAKKDATEFTKAKMFYGDGAGTRRKLIKAKVESRSAKDPNYKKAFDHHVGKTDMGRRAEQARGTRRRKDVVSGTAKTARGIKNLAMKTGAPVAMSAVILYGAAQNPAVRSVVTNAGRATMNTATSYVNGVKLRKEFRNLFG